MRVSIITGGGSGIGAAVARRLAGEGQRLVLQGQGADDAARARLAAVAAECERAGAPYVGVNFVGLLHAGPTVIAAQDSRGVPPARGG